MMGVIIVIHTVICIALIGLILVQRGRGGGFVDSFSGLDSMFGTKTSSFLTKLTTILAISFFCTCLALALLSLKQSRSLMRDIKIKQPAAETKSAVNATASSPASQEKAQVEEKSSVVKEEIPVNRTQAQPLNK
jgi:preprotein translocase subunit SecG